MTLSLVSIISRGVSLRYPLPAVLASAAPLVEQIIINVDTTFPDGTLDQVWRTLKDLGIPYEIIENPWDWNNRDSGSELAIQSNLAIARAKEPWVLYLQADEAVHEDDHEDIRWLLGLPEEFTAAQFMRLYFFGSPKTLRKDWTQPLVRMFRRGKARSVGDAMDTRVHNGLVWPHSDGTPRIFHYSRCAPPDLIGQRIRNLDGLFHPEENLAPARPYDFGLRVFDTHATTEYPAPVDSSVLERYDGIHPASMRKWLAESFGAGADGGTRA